MIRFLCVGRHLWRYGARRELLFHENLRREGIIFSEGKLLHQKDYGEGIRISEGEISEEGFPTTISPLRHKSQISRNRKGEGAFTFGNTISALRRYT